MAQKVLLAAPILNAEPVVRSAGYTPVVNCLVETSTNCNPWAPTWPDVFLSLKNEGAEKFQGPWYEQLDASQAERDTAAKTQQSCRAGQFGQDR